MEELSIEDQAKIHKAKTSIKKFLAENEGLSGEDLIKKQVEALPESVLKAAERKVKGADHA